MELEGVGFADFGADGQMAVIRDEEPNLTLEYPVGHVIAQGQAGLVVPRVSPTGEYVAFFDMRTASLTVTICDRSGKSVAQSPPLADWWGLAWTPTNELWFAATETGGVQTSVFSLDLHGRRRVVYRAPGSFTLHDISTQGDVLASFDHPLSRIELIDGADTAPQDRSWRDGGYVVALSSTHALLVNQSGGSGSGGARGSVYLRQPGVQQPVRIAEGQALALSPDGGKALVYLDQTPPTVSVVPTGAGRPNALDLGPIDSVKWAGWQPDGRMVIQFTRQGGKPIVYQLSPDGGNPTALLPEGVTLRGANLISPDGSRIAAMKSGGQLVVCTMAAPACRPVPGAGERDTVAGWTADGKFLFVYRREVVPTQVDRIDVETGARTAWKTVHPLHTAVSGIASLIASPDGSLAYSYNLTRSELYVIKGLK
jgi:hypothetical protein